MQYIAFDAHKHYTLASVERLHGGAVHEERIPHERGALRRFLHRCELGSPVAVEALGNWYWIVDEIEDAGFVPRLVHPRKAKLMLGMINKTDTYGGGAVKGGLGTLVLFASPPSRYVLTRVAPHHACMARTGWSCSRCDGGSALRVRRPMS